MVETSLENFRNGVKPSHFADMRPSEIVAYQKIFQVLATVSSSPRAAKQLMAAILLQAADAENSGLGDD